MICGISNECNKLPAKLKYHAVSRVNKRPCILQNANKCKQSYLVTDSLKLIHSPSLFNFEVNNKLSKIRKNPVLFMTLKSFSIIYLFVKEAF